MGIPLGAPGESLIYNLVDLMSRLNFHMRLANFGTARVFGTVNSPFWLCHGMSLGWSFLRFLGSSSPDSEDNDESPPSDPPSLRCRLSLVSKLDNLARAV